MGYSQHFLLRTDKAVLVFPKISEQQWGAVCYVLVQNHLADIVEKPCRVSLFGIDNLCLVPCEQAIRISNFVASSAGSTVAYDARRQPATRQEQGRGTILTAPQTGAAARGNWFAT